MQILLRAIEPADADLIYKWENNQENWSLSNTLAPFSKYIIEKYIETAHLDIYQTKQLRLMIDMNTEQEQIKTIGAIDLFDFDPFHLRAGVGILIANELDREKGYAYHAVEEIKKYAANVLQLHQLYCNITDDNKASIRLFEKTGFKKAGTKREWIKTTNGFIDEHLYQILLK